MRKGLIAFCVIAAIGYQGYQLIFPTYHARYRLTVDIDDNGVTRTGSGVVDISYGFWPKSLNLGTEGPRFSREMKGCAITIDLKKSGLLFVVDSPSDLRLGSGGLVDLPLVAYGYPRIPDPAEMKNNLKHVLSRTGPVELPIDKLPMIVRFKDLAKPFSIEEVDPKNFEKFGLPGVHIIKAVFELTDAPVSAVPPSWPKWLAEQDFEPLDTKTAPLGSSRGVDFTAFRGT